MSDDLLLRPATELAALLRSRELSARELLAASTTRRDEVDPVLNALVVRDDERAGQRAAELDEVLARTGLPVGPLHGLPTAHKDLLDAEGLVTSFGSTLFAGNVARRDSVLAARVRAAGAVRVGKTNTAELGAGSQTHNPLFGITRNPYDPTRTPGGSSGGAAAALATGMVAVADGSDMGGSLRNPASFCNVVGLRPTPGRVPNVPSRDAWFDLSVLGPMGRRAADVALLLAAVSGPDPRDPYATWPPMPVPTALDRDLSGVRAAWGGDLGLPYEPAVLAAHDRARAGVESLGLVLTDAEPTLRGADEVFRVLRGWHMATTIGDAVERGGDAVGPMVRGNVAYGRTVTAEQLAAAQHRRTALLQAAAGFFAEHDYLFLPVSQVLPFDAEQPWVREVGGEVMPDYLGWMRSAYLVSVLRSPAASVPAGFTPEGLPVGLQVVGRPGDDLGVLQVAHALEQVFRAHERPPDLAALRG